MGNDQQCYFCKCPQKGNAGGEFVTYDQCQPIKQVIRVWVCSKKDCIVSAFTINWSENN